MGAGLGGIGAALGFLNGGHEVEILEAAPEIGEVNSFDNVCDIGFTIAKMR